MRGLRHAARLLADLVVYSWRTGRWWVPVVTVVLALSVVAVAVAKIAVPTVVYAFF